MDNDILLSNSKGKVTLLPNSIDFGKFYQEDAPSYGAYDNIRKIASFVDGLKLSQRKVLHTLFKKFPNPSTENKTARLASSVAECTEYLHGEASLTQVLDTMAASFVGSNNYPLVTGHGNFGTRFSGAGSAAAPRYTYCSIAPISTKLFPEVDRGLCQPQVFEGSQIEPVFMMPIFPVLFLNGTDGISTGWKTTIYPRNPKDIIKYIRAVLNKSDKVPHIENSLPWFKGFAGETKVVKEKNAAGETTKKVMNFGVVEKVNSNTLHITEIPITYTYASYIKVLDGLEEKGAIEDYEDLSDPKTDKFEFIVKVKRVFFESNPDVASWIKAFNLAKPLNEQLNCIDETNRIHEFNDVKEILDSFIKTRLIFYGRRKDYLLKKYMEDIQLDVSRYVWCKGVIDETIHIKNKKKDDIVKQLEKTDKIVQKDGSYNYLLNMPMSSITKEKMVELTEKIKALKELIKETQKQSIEEMWLADLDEIAKEF